MKKILLIFLPLIILSCGTKTEVSLTESEKELIKSELQTVMSQLIQNSENLNLSKATEPYLDYPGFKSISNGRVSNYTDFMIENKHYYEALKSQKFSNSEIIYTLINNKSVIITWNCSAHVQMKDDQELKIDPYTVTFVFKKVNGLWKVIYAHGSGVFVP